MKSEDYLSIQINAVLEQHIRMICEGTYDTKDWSNDAGNSALHHRNKMCIYILMETFILKLNYNSISQFYWFYCIYIKSIQPTSLLKNILKVLQLLQ